MIAAAADPISFLSGGNDIRRAMMWAIVFALCWAVLEIGLGSLLRNPYPLLQIVWCRYAVHLGVAAAIWAWRRPPMWQTERPAFQLARSLLMLTMPGAFAWAVMAGVSVEFVWAVFWIAPLLIVAFAGVALGERPPRRSCSPPGSALSLRPRFLAISAQPHPWLSRWRWRFRSLSAYTSL